MAQFIAPVIVNPGLQAEATAGNQSATFTATDRKLIEERGGALDKTADFKTLFMRRDFTSKVENEQSTVKQEEDITELEARKREHAKMLKHSNRINPHERATISQPAAPEAAIIPAPIIRRGSSEPVLANLESVEVNEEPAEKKLSKEAAKIAKELNLDPIELFEKFALEQNELHSLIYKIKELHLKRLLSNTSEEFVALTEEINKETLASGREEARQWLAGQLDDLTKGAAEYKIKLLKSLDSIGLDPHQEKAVKWLQGVVARLSASRN
ncbi:MAG: hypothetical protein WC529_07255 [Candidatus Margulisiibacteriota bacterium]